MKLYLLQGVSLIQGTGYTNTIGLFCKKPTLKDLQKIFDKYDVTSEKLLDILNGDYSIIGDYEYTLEVFDIDNKEILTNMNEEIKVLLCNNTATSCVVCAVVGNPTEDDIPENDLNHIKNHYESHYYDSAEDALEHLFNNTKNGLITSDDLQYEWDIINTKDIK